MTERYVVIGNPVAHSKSPLIHTEFARQTRQDLSYETILAPLDGFTETVKRFQLEGGKGANITVPFKREAWQLSTRMSERAELAQAVNTLRFDDGETYGDNTDGAGLVRDLRLNLGYPLENKRILLMGAGGASCGVLSPLLAEKPISLTIANRRAEKARALTERFKPFGDIRSSDYAALAGKQFDLVINATSASLNNELPPLPDGIFAHTTLAYDMAYGTASTKFLSYAAQQHAGRVADGLGMLVEQAAESFFLWRGVWPDTKPVIALLRNLG